MHDPMTLAFELKLGKCRLVEIWHVDPETDGSDDSCGWGFPRLTEREMECAKELIHNEYDNLRWWFKDVSDYEAVYRIKQIFRLHKRVSRPWYQHPRWHIHHWQIRIVPVREFKRWAFSRCAYCGGRFKWGSAPTSTRWNGTGPLWFKSEEQLYHHDCYSEKRQDHQ